MVKNILIVGVGGQGTLLASRVLGKVALDMGCDVKLSEVHGMAQRGGSVVTHVRYGQRVDSPIIDKGRADIILAFEELEGLRFLPYLSSKGKIFVNTKRIMPLHVVAGTAKYPDDAAERISAAADAVFVDAQSMAAKAGNLKALNIVLLGVMASDTGIDRERFSKAIRETVKPAFVELNLKAFNMGYEAVK